jgi:hypothetical protein
VSKHYRRLTTLVIFIAVVRNREGGKGFWTCIGSSWARKDGNGFNIQAVN